MQHKMLPWKNGTYPMMFAGEMMIGLQYPNKFIPLQTTAITKEAIPSK